jgi:hypothetical protein
VYKNQQRRQQEVGIWWVQKCFPRYGVPIWSLWPNIRSLPSIVAENNWWQKSDNWSQASYRYPISWEAFLDPSDSYFLFADFDDFSTHMFNVYRNQLSRQTGSRNLTGPKTLPTIWHAYMKFVTKYQIPVINSFLYTLNIYAHFSSHFSQQQLMAEIWYLVTSFIFFYKVQISTNCRIISSKSLSKEEHADDTIDKVYNLTF